jgi:hypothetical protein
VFASLNITIERRAVVHDSGIYNYSYEVQMSSNVLISFRRSTCQLNRSLTNRNLCSEMYVIRAGSLNGKTIDSTMFASGYYIVYDS